MTIHKEGYRTIAICTIVFAIVNLLSFYFLSFYLPALSWIIFIGTLALLLFTISFFRIPKRTLTIDGEKIISPCDGKVVVIEETVDEEYFRKKNCRYPFL